MTNSTNLSERCRTLRNGADDDIPLDGELAIRDVLCRGHFWRMSGRTMRKGRTGEDYPKPTFAALT